MHEHEREQPLILPSILTGISLWTFKYLFSRLDCSKIFFSAAERFKIPWNLAATMIGRDFIDERREKNDTGCEPTRMESAGIENNAYRAP